MFINETGLIGTIINNAVINNSGNLVSAILIIFIILAVIAIMFSIPIDVTLILLLPLLIACMAYLKEFAILGIAVVFLLGIIFTKLFFIR